MESSGEWINTSGMGKDYPAPPEVMGWSWGGFFLTWIWAVSNRTWIGLLALLPFIGLIMRFVLGAKGREWAWQNKRWDSVEHFNRVQRNWAWGFLVVLVVPGVLAAIAIPAYSDYVAKARLVGAVDYAHAASNAVGHYMRINGTLPDNVKDAGLESPLPNGVQGVDIDGQTGVLKVTMEVGRLRGNAFYLTPAAEADGRLSWQCLHGEIPAKLMPKECRFDTAN